MNPRYSVGAMICNSLITLTLNIPQSRSISLKNQAAKKLQFSCRKNSLWKILSSKAASCGCSSSVEVRNLKYHHELFKFSFSFTSVSFCPLSSISSCFRFLDFGCRPCSRRSRECFDCNAFRCFLLFRCAASKQNT